MAVEAQPAKPARTLTTLGLVVVGFFWTSGGFYGSEVAMDGPPLYVLIICLTMPLLYSLPTALISAELATNYPETGGQCVYVTLACGELIGAHNTWWVWFSTAVDAAIYPQYIRDSLRNEFHDQIPEDVYALIPTLVVVFVTMINIAGVDWLVRFETLLGVLALIPCLIVLGFGLPQIKLAPLLSTEYISTGETSNMPSWMTDMIGDLPLPSMISRSLWLYGGFTNLGVLAGEAITPRRSYLIAVAILVPLKILLRFVPFIIAYSVGTDGADLSTAGYFATMAEKVSDVGHSNGQWLRWMYFVGSIVCFLGFYNAMAVNAERTAFYFCEERFARSLTKASTYGGRVGRFLFDMPGHEGGIRRIYILVVAILELGLINVPVGLLIELEMLIYALSAGLFFYAYVYLRFQRTRMFKQGPSNPENAPLMGGGGESLMYGVDAEAEGKPGSGPEIFNVGGGNVVACLMVVFPVSVFAANTFINLIDSGLVQDDNTTLTDDPGTFKVPFAYFKLAVVVGIIAIGGITHVIYAWCKRRSLAKEDLVGRFSDI